MIGRCSCGGRVVRLNAPAPLIDEDGQRYHRFRCLACKSEYKQRVRMPFKEKPMPLEVLDTKVQLHQCVKILYMVTHYEATLYTTDGERKVDSGIGETIFEALQDLERRVADFDVRRR